MWKKIILSFASAMFLHSAYAAEPAENSLDRANANAAAQMWLEMVDHKHYDKSWDETCAYFKARMSKDSWIKQLASLRTNTGRVQARQLTSEEIQYGIPEDHKVNYYLLKYSSSFQKKSNATETVTMMQDKDGYWRLAGYFIK